MTKKISFVLVMCMMLTLFAGIGVQAASNVDIADGKYPGYFKDVYGNKTDSNLEIDQDDDDDDDDECEAEISVLRLCSMDDLNVTSKNGKIIVKGLDPNGERIVLKGKIKNKKLVLKITKTTWMYFNKGDKFVFKIK